ncbi:Imm26 family immunity protein [Geobacter sulfurreducens]|uniref:Imm26 family immunity protein n=1 Tax=Geobacter sulfurreducens TaxID=35554 RepID=UPI0020B76D60|nr:Imm26 family immunity protein [Geobacter sulfurreducens]UTG93649.1 hypothetical protein J8622_04805 [Geobacter sulfurreducens]
MKYPFEPKSTAYLRPGQFWSVPLPSGKYACGRVLQVNATEIPSKNRAFFGGLLDWLGNKPPTSEDIADCPLIAFGNMHIKAIIMTGGVIIGERRLEEDHIELPLLLSAQGGPGTMILRGAESIREAQRDEWGTLPVLGTWGYNFICKLAEAKLEKSA